MGILKRRGEIVLLLHALPRVNTVSSDEILYFIEVKRVMRLGIGLVDVPLLASAIMTNSPLWTIDSRLE